MVANWQCDEHIYRITFFGIVWVCMIFKKLSKLVANVKKVDHSTLFFLKPEFTASFKISGKKAS